ncbi:MAG: hypothetical protein ACOYYS_07560 [Chloroflexota bacterium]
MAKNRAKQRSDRLFQNLEAIATRQAAEHTGGLHDGDENTDGILAIKGQAVQAVPDSTRLPRMKKFRFQLLHQWLIHNFPACRAADIGGGKGLLGYLLMQSGWQATLIDPMPQALPDKYKDIVRGIRVKIDPAAQVPNLPAAFEREHAAGFDLLIGMHAHGCNVKIIEAAAHYGCGFVIFPCCVIDEPFYPPLGVHWLESLADYAVQQGHSVRPFRLNFKGQNIGLVSFGRLALQPCTA